MNHDTGRIDMPLCLSYLFQAQMALTIEDQPLLNWLSPSPLFFFFLVVVVVVGGGGRGGIHDSRGCRLAFVPCVQVFKLHCLYVRMYNIQFYISWFYLYFSIVVMDIVSQLSMKYLLSFPIYRLRRKVLTSRVIIVYVGSRMIRLAFKLRVYHLSIPRKYTSNLL